MPVDKKKKIENEELDQETLDALAAIDEADDEDDDKKDDKKPAFLKKKGDDSDDDSDEDEDDDKEVSESDDEDEDDSDDDKEDKKPAFLKKKGAKDEEKDDEDDDIDEENQLDEFLASGSGEVADPVAPIGGSSKRANDNSQGDKSPPKLTRAAMMGSIIKDLQRADHQTIQKVYDNHVKITGNAHANRKDSKQGQQGTQKIDDGKMKSGFKEDLDEAFGEGFTDEFKAKASVIFEAALNEHIVTKYAALEEHFSTKLEEATVEIEEAYLDKIDSYLNYVAEQWLKENEVAITSALKVEIAEDFMKGLKNTFAENYIEIPEDKVDIVDEITQKNEDLEEAVNTVTKEKIDLQDQLKALQVEAKFNEISESLTDTETERLRTLISNVDYNSIVDYEKKLRIVAENYFGDSIVLKDLNESNDDLDANEVIIEDEKKPLDGRMADYAKAISYSVKSL